MCVCNILFPLTFLQLDLPAVSGPQSVFPLLLPRRRVLVFSRRSGDDARLFHPELVNLRCRNRDHVSGCLLNSKQTQFMEHEASGAHLSAGLGADEPRDGTEVVVVRPDENPEERSLGAAPVHRFSFTRQLHLHRSLTAGVSL